MGTGGYVKVLRYLEDPDIVCATRESDTSCRDQQSSTPLVKARFERHRGNISGAQLSLIRVCASSCVGVRGLHVAYGCSHISWRWSGVVGCIHTSINYR